MVVRKFIVERNGSEVTWEVRGDAPEFEVRREGDEDWRSVRLDPGGYAGFHVLMIDNNAREVYLERERNQVLATVGRHVIPCEVTTWRPESQRRSKRASEQEGQITIKAPMTGSVVEVMCAVGDHVAAGTVVMVIESMKMNNELRAPADATIVAIPSAAGDRVNAGQPLVVLEAVAAE